MTTAEQPVTYDELVEALDKAVDAAIWMSGSNDFGPEGIAHEGWLKVRPRLLEALKVLRETGGVSTLIEASNQDSGSNDA